MSSLLPYRMNTAEIRYASGAASTKEDDARRRSANTGPLASSWRVTTLPCITMRFIDICSSGIGGDDAYRAACLASIANAAPARRGNLALAATIAANSARVRAINAIMLMVRPPQTSNSILPAGSDVYLTCRSRRRGV